MAEGFGIKESLAPSRVTIMPDYIVVSNEYARTIVVIGYPSLIRAGWLLELVTFQGKVDVSIHVHPMGRESAVVLLNSEVSKLQVELAVKARAGKVDTAELESKLASAVEFREKIAGRDANLFTVSLYITVRAEDKYGLDRLTKEVVTILKSLMVKTLEPRYRHEFGYRSNVPLCTNMLGRHYTMDTAALASAFPFISTAYVQNSGVLYGINAENATPVIFDMFSLESYNTVIFGQTGSGKSYACKLELLRYFVLDPKLRVYVIDPMGEFLALTEALGGQVVNVGKNAINPLDVERTDRVNEKVERLKVLFGTMFDLSPDEYSVLDTALLEAYAHKENPQLSDLEALLGTMKNLHAQRLANLLTPYVSGTMKFMNQQTGVDLRKRLVCFNIADMNEQMHPALMFMILDFVYSKLRQDLEKKLVVVDESWLLMQRPQTAQFIANLSRHTRHYHAGLTLISQNAEDFLKSEHGMVVMKNSAVALLMRHRHVSEEMAGFYRLTEAEKKFVLFAKTGKETGYSEGLLVAGSAHIPIQVVASAAEHEIATTNPEELRERKRED